MTGNAGEWQTVRKRRGAGKARRPQQGPGSSRQDEAPDSQGIKERIQGAVDELRTAEFWDACKKLTQGCLMESLVTGAEETGDMGAPGGAVVTSTEPDCPSPDPPSPAADCAGPSPDRPSPAAECAEPSPDPPSPAADCAEPSPDPPSPAADCAEPSPDPPSPAADCAEPSPDPPSPAADCAGPSPDPPSPAADCAEPSPDPPSPATNCAGPSPDPPSPAADCAGAAVDCVCYGLGRFSSCASSRYQLALLLLLLESLQIPASRCYIYDPMFSNAEVGILEDFGMTVLTENEEGKRPAHRPTLFYLIHCGKALYNNLLWRNWSARSLSQLTVIGNSFHGIEERLLTRDLQRDYKYISDMLGIVREVPFPDSPRYLEIFNDTSVHCFPAERLHALPPELWDSPAEPDYQEDLEIIRAAEGGQRR
ncbi:SRR1-like protein isoform X2 [Acipenser oxyrinchus oxyrinchus]|uniref:SRR1-like protein isoform X2 n=1 Tax=Acipenser oxyrinchus oxyrinchus TaxID=40147 RepID=A0AAD8FZY6_ACIOX|nr:SRR1-like protein isoform X2 [Acipenser oxyrinchus oxyrinchus]